MASGSVLGKIEAHLAANTWDTLPAPGPWLVPIMHLLYLSHLLTAQRSTNVQEETDLESVPEA